MKNVNEIVYQKLLLQAEEAKKQNMIKLANAVMTVTNIGPENQKDIKYSYGQLNDDIYQEMWKMATHVIKYYDQDSIDIEKLSLAIEILTDTFIKEMELSLGTNDIIIGPLEPKVLGESK